MPDDNSLAGRVRRYAQVSTAMGGLAARLAGERYLGLNLDRGRHAAELKTVLGGIKGEQLEVLVDGERVKLFDWDKEIANTTGNGRSTPPSHCSALPRCSANGSRCRRR